QTAGGAGSVTAASLAVGASGDVDLCQVANSVGTFSAILSAAGDVFGCPENSSVGVGRVAADSLIVEIYGVTTTNSAAPPFTNDIDLVSTTGPITLTQAVNAGNATVRLNSGGAITQMTGGAGSITANGLAVVAAGNVDLCQVANNVTGNFAALDTAAGAFV